MKKALERAPVALFVYNRPWHTQQTVEALLKNGEAKETDLIVFSDGPKRVEDAPMVAEVRKYVHSIAGFRSVRVVEREQNYGLAKSIITGVTEVVNEYGKLIVLEDDLVTSPYFLRYMNDALTCYEFEDKVICVNSYVFPVKGALPESFFLRGGGSLGWATWQRGWNLFEADGQKLLDSLTRLDLLGRFDFNGAYPYTDMLKNQIAGKNSSWAVRWHASAFLLDKLTLFPAEPLVRHIGNDGSGTHYDNSKGVDDFMGDRIAARPIAVGGIALEHNTQVAWLYEQHFRAFQHSWLRSLKNRIRRFLS